MQNHFVVDAINRRGGLILFWSNDISIKIVSYSQSHIEALILNAFDLPLWHFLGFYDNPNQGLCQHSWDLLDQLCKQDALPLLIGGDWNEILHPAKKKVVILVRSSRCGHSLILSFSMIWKTWVLVSFSHM